MSFQFPRALQAPATAGKRHSGDAYRILDGDRSQTVLAEGLPKDKALVVARDIRHTLLASAATDAPGRHSAIQSVLARHGVGSGMKLGR